MFLQQLGRAPKSFLYQEISKTDSCEGIGTHTEGTRIKYTSIYRIHSRGPRSKPSGRKCTMDTQQSQQHTDSHGHHITPAQHGYGHINHGDNRSAEKSIHLGTQYFIRSRQRVEKAG